MALKNRILLSIFISFSTLVHSKVYPELMAKQSSDNLRLLSSDGKFTYYQRRSGSLHFSRNYKILDILKSNMGTQYTLYSTPAKKKILISQDSNFNTFLSTRMKEKIFVINYGESFPREVGLGIGPRLHVDDNWISFYDPYEKIINFEHSTNYALKFSIKINNRINPYFIPQVVMLDENTVLYTDLGESGNPGLIIYKRNLGTSEILYKQDSPMVKLELNLCRGNIIFSEFGIYHSKLGSKIFILGDRDNLIKNKSNIYSSTFDDIGHVTCDFQNDLIYFVKNTGDIKNDFYEIAELNFKDKKTQLLTDLKYSTTLINMDGLILTFDKGKYLIVKGEVDLKNVDMLKSSNTTEDKK